MVYATDNVQIDNINLSSTVSVQYKSTDFLRIILHHMLCVTKVRIMYVWAACIDQAGASYNQNNKFSLPVTLLFIYTSGKYLPRDQYKCYKVF